MNRPLHSFVGRKRARAGLSLTDLAARVGISRQALSAIETGRSTPSTAVALRLAAALRCRVEELFALPSPVLPDVDGPGPPGTRVVLGRVGERWVAHAVSARSTEAADGLVDEAGGVEALQDPSLLAQRVLVAGCAPVLGALAMHLGQGAGGARWLQRTSTGALRDLAQQRTHVAGLHLAPAHQPTAHDPLIRHHLPGVAVLVVGLVGWREGLALPAGNPAGVHGVADVAERGLRVAQRPAGAGATQVLARELAAVGSNASDLAGPAVASHVDAAHAVLHGAADAAVLVEPVAEAFGLCFLPLAEEHFELVVRAEHAQHRGVQRLLDQLTTVRFAREVSAMGAYDTAPMGQARRLEAA
ncbi:MAG: helix-turn-helix domain-containing protein [Myxococcales bacterium]|nr:helix-turn-helix domain-containing protein [Myxococcales bacterium]